MLRVQVCSPTASVRNARFARVSACSKLRRATASANRRACRRRDCSIHPAHASHVRRAGPDGLGIRARQGANRTVSRTAGGYFRSSPKGRAGVRTPAELLAGRSGSMWDGKDPVASIAEYLCCSEGMWRNRVESRGNGVGLLTTQRSRVQIPPPPPLLSRAFALHLLLGESLRGLLLAEGSGTTVPDPFCVPPRIRSATVAASLCMPGMTWP
jgi:hypothetical protein